MLMSGVMTREQQRGYYAVLLLLKPKYILLTIPMYFTFTLVKV